MSKNGIHDSAYLLLLDRSQVIQQTEEQKNPGNTTHQFTGCIQADRESLPLKT